MHGYNHERPIKAIVRGRSVLAVRSNLGDATPAILVSIPW